MEETPAGDQPSETVAEGPSGDEPGGSPGVKQYIYHVNEATGQVVKFEIFDEATGKREELPVPSAETAQAPWYAAPYSPEVLAYVDPYAYQAWAAWSQAPWGYGYPR